MRLRSSTGTDKHQHYVDDGLQQKFEPLHREALDLGKELTTMASLISASFSVGFLACREGPVPLVCD